MSLLDAVSTCWPPGVDGCVAWWDAWAVATAAVALLVAIVGVLVAGASAFAVWSLGREANGVAKATQALAQMTQEMERAERQREARVIKDYLRGEIEAAAAQAKTLVEMFQHIGMNELIQSRKRRDQLRQQYQLIDLQLAQAIVGRLHRLEGIEAGYIAKALGMHGRIRAFAMVTWEMELDEHSASGVIKTLERDAQSLADNLYHFATACKAQGR